MRSRAHIKGHPLHPILVSFPIAFFTGTLISDTIFLATGRFLFSQMAFYLALGGIVFSLIAAIPGIVDYFTVVPPESSAKKRATKHGLLNIGVLLVFTMVLLLKNNPEMSIYVILALEVTSAVILTIAGWMGGTLVHRNQIGVDHRYADAGKWKEESIDQNMELKDLDTLKVNQMKLFHVNGKRIVIGHTESGFVAFDDFCTHRGGCLADGALICGIVQCPWHGSQFDVRTGEVKAGPAKEPIKTYPIESRGQRYFLKL